MSDKPPIPRLPRTTPAAMRALRRLLDRLARRLARERKALDRQREIDPELWWMVFKGVA